MESSTSTSHFRSISLPSRLTNPSHEAIETKIKELKALRELVCSSQTIQTGLVKLAELYVCVDELFRSPQTQQDLSQYRSRTFVEEALEGSIVLLDSCSVIKEHIMQMKEQTQILQSALRRKGDELSIANQIAVHLRFRKKAKKSIIKSLVTLKHIEKKMNLTISFPDLDHHVLMFSKVVGEINELTISIFRSLLVFLSAKSKTAKGVEILSKMVLKSKSTHEQYKVLLDNEVETADTSLMLLYKRAHEKEMKESDVQMTLRKLAVLDVSIDGFEGGLNCLYRRLVQNRASFLNVVTC